MNKVYGGNLVSTFLSRFLFKKSVKCTQNSTGNLVASKSIEDPKCITVLFVMEQI